jgi:putative ABC transport system permease protein
LSRFDERFKDKSAAVEEELQRVGDEIADLRRRLLKERAGREISKAAASLELVRGTMANSEKELQESEDFLTESEQSLLSRRYALYEQILSGRRQIESGRAELMDPRLDISLAETVLSEKRNELLYSADVLEEGFYSGLVKLSAAEAELSLARDALENGRASVQAEKASAETLITTAEATLSAARSATKAMPDAKCYVLGLDLNENFESFRQDSERVGSISRTFPLFFFLVAALVAFTCMVRIVEDDRSVAGLMQSLGYSSGRIFGKYMAYAFCIGIPGAVLGIAVGYRFFPMIVFDFGYRIMYVLPRAEKLFYPDLGSMVCTVTLVSVLVPAALVSASNTTQIPATLMRPKAPLPGKRIFLENIRIIWVKLNFSAKVTARNILRYKKRFFMTIAGISGCTAVVLTGFGLQDSIRTVADKQFDNIYRYDFVITVTDGQADRAALERYLISRNEVTDWQYQRRENIEVSLETNGASYKTTLVVPEENEHMADFIILKEKGSGRLVLPSDNGVLITQKLASLLGVRAGDEINILDEDDKEWRLAINGVVENYVGHYLYMSPRYYSTVMGAEPDYTTIIGKAPGPAREHNNEFSEDLLANDAVATLLFNSRVREFYDDTLNALNIVVLVLIACGALLAFVVLFCITGINIDERKREIATLKVLGFYDGEASTYIFRENIVNTVIGSLLGLGLGVLLHQYIIRTVELDMIVFGKVVEPLSYAYAFALTFVFTFVVNAVMSGDIKDIDMIESLKSIE